MSFQPTSPDDLQRWISARSETRQPVTWLPRWGSGADAAPCSLDLRPLNQVIDFPARDMTITVQTGLTIAELQRQLTDERQWLPVNVPDPEQTTVAELIVRHWMGALVTGYGTIRDWLLGVTAVDGTGRLFHSGGRVVKNVAGYDLCKLLVGSQGNLAIPVEATLQVRSAPAQLRGQSTFVDSLEQLQTAAESLTQLPFKPVVQEARYLGGWQLLTAVEGTEAIAADLSQQLRQTLQSVSPSLKIEEQAWRAESDSLSQLWAQRTDDPAEICLRIGVRPSQTLSVLESGRQLGLRGTGQLRRGHILLTGVLSEEKQRKLTHFLKTVSATVSVVSGSASLKNEANSQRLQLSSWPLIQKIKAEFDPQGILEPSNWPGSESV